MVLALHQRLWLGFDCFYLATMRGRDVMRYKPSLMCIFLFKKKRNQSYESVIDYLSGKVLQMQYPFSEVYL